MKEKEELKTLLEFKNLRVGKQDMLFFIDTYLWTFNPKYEPYHFRFKLFPFQRELALNIKDSIIKGEDLFIEKCREMGATYTTLAVLFWFWRFVPGSNFLIGSRKEDYVDNTKGNMGEVSNKEESLFGKLEYFINHLDPVTLPKGFDSSIKEDGVNLSGGQQQCLALSRGLTACHDKDIVLLDEPTSSLDMITGIAVYQNIFRDFKGKTIISTVHQLQLLPLFDRICVFDKGQIVASGTLQELLSSCPKFVSFWEAMQMAQAGESAIAGKISIFSSRTIRAFFFSR